MMYMVLPRTGVVNCAVIRTGLTDMRDESCSICGAHPPMDGCNVCAGCDAWLHRDEERQQREERGVESQD